MWILRVPGVHGFRPGVLAGIVGILMIRMCDEDRGIGGVTPDNNLFRWVSG